MQRLCKVLLLQLHFRYELGFKPPALDRKMHKLEVRLVGVTNEKHDPIQLTYRYAYIAKALKLSLAGIPELFRVRPRSLSSICWASASRCRLRNATDSGPLEAAAAASSFATHVSRAGC